MEELKILQKVSDTQGCEGCKMQQLFPDNIFVPPKWGTGKRLAIAEAPGEVETQTGEPLTGGSGTWYDLCNRKAGIKREEVTLVNVIQCRPPNNLFPSDPEAKSYISPKDAAESISCCRRAHLQPVLEDRKWERIDILGEKPLRYVLGKQDGIFKWRGSPLPVPGLSDKPLAIATLHPAYLARDQVMLPVTINDLRKSLVQPPERYILHPTLEQVKEFHATEFAFDIETAYWWGDAKKILMVGLSDALYSAIVVPFQGPYISELKRIFKQARSVIHQNGIQFDLPFLRDFDVEISPDCESWDIMLMQHLRFPDLPHDLEFIGSQFTGKGVWKDKKRENFELYCARDVDVTFQCWKQLKPMLQHEGLLDLYRDVQVPLAKICKLMSDTGFKINPARIGEVREKITEEIIKEEHLLPESLRSHKVTKNKRKPAPVGTLGKSGKPVKFITEPYEEVESPWASSTQVGKYLYTELALEPVHDLKTGKITTGKMALDKLFNRTKNPAIRSIKLLRKKASMLNLFAKEEMLKIGNIHTHFNVHGTASGRLSSSDPNLQNITESARFLYVPHHVGWSIIDVDYSGIENRLTAYFAGDIERMERFITIPGFSEHRYLASKMTGIPYEEIEKDNDKDAPYGRAKRVCHGSNYGMGAKKISLTFDLDFKETKELLEAWKKEIWKTVQWQNRLAEQAKKEGFLTTPFGRKRYFYTTSYYTESLSFLPQSAAADIIFRAMLGLLYERIGVSPESISKVVGYVEPLPKPANLLIQVHDSLIVECPNGMVPEVVGVLKRVMEQPFKELGGLVLPIGVAVGPSWGETESYTRKII